MTQAKLSFKRSTLGAAIAVAITSTAAVHAATYNFSVSSIAQVSISERQALFFGTDLKLAASGVCGLTPLADTVSFRDTDSFAVTLAVATGVAAVGTGCSDTTATTSNHGHYLLSGAASSPVKITVSSGASDDGTSYTFQPAGLIDVDAATTTPADGTTTIVANIEQTVTLDTSGEAALLVGGNITIGLTDLAAETAFPGSFDIDVTY